MANIVELNEVEVCVALWSRSYQVASSEALVVSQPDMDNRHQIIEFFVNNIDPDLLIDINQLVMRSLIGEGRYSIVYSGLYRSYPVAVKITISEQTTSADPDHRAKFERELLVLSKVKHENIVELIGASVEPAMLIVTELMFGGTLQKYLWTLRPNRLDLKLAMKFALDISRAMECLHSNGIIHRNLKPVNLLLTNDKKTVKVAGFGLAREETEEEKTIEAGTYRWMAPELYNMEALVTGRKYYNHKVDIYSFSMVLWELLTNTTPFRGRTTMSVAYAVLNEILTWAESYWKNIRPSVEDIPSEIIPLLESCWSADPACRPEFSEITSFLENFYQSLFPVEIQPPSPSTVQIEETDQLANSESEPEPKPKLKPILEIKPKPESESKPEIETEPKPEPGPKSKPKPNGGCEGTVFKPGKKEKTKMSQKVLQLFKRFTGCFHKKID